MHLEEIFFEEILDYFRLGLKLDVVCKKEIIAWADRHLLNDRLKDRQHVLVELSLVQKQSVKTVSAFISSLIGIESTILGCRLLLGRLGSIKAIEKVIPSLDRMLERMPLFEIELEKIGLICFDFDVDQLYYYFSEKEFELAKTRAADFFQLYNEYNIEHLDKLEEKEKKLLNNLYNIPND